jgi:hypothetical protein
LAVRSRLRYRREESPLYNQALGPAQDTLVVVPPFTYPGVTARVFPLRANLNLLRGFCNRYLNVAPDLYQLIPYVPYVLLVVLDYGRMALENRNLGWVSQHEILFEVPLGMWRKKEGRWIFEGWVVNTPFIVVDNAASLTTGREVYGWPKVLAELRDSPERWLMDPRNPTRYLTLDVKGIDSDAPNIPLLEIDQQSGQNPSLLPMDLDMLDPLGRLSRLARTSMSAWRDLAELFVRPPLAGYGRLEGSLADLGTVLSSNLRQLADFLVMPGLDVVTLKQFRDAEFPDLICYQALVRSRLSVARYNRGGLLGLNNILRGDVTGGFRIRLFENSAFPIVESLGLQVAQERTARGHQVSFLEPVFPFWMSIDLTYNTGKTLCWRTRDRPWQDETTRTSRVPPPGVSRVSPPDEPFFNTIAGGAEQVWRGPYLIPEASFNVYPLRASYQQLNTFLHRYLKAGGKLAFELVPAPGEKEIAYVYMAVSANRIFSQERSGAYIQASQVTFSVLLHLKGFEQRVLAMPFAFVDNPVLATSMREVKGVPAIYATIDAPSQFLRSGRPLLKVQVDVFEALGAGLRSGQQTLLKVVPGEAGPACPPPPPALDGSAFVPERWGTIERLMLKQFRDAEEPDLACYQALILEPWSPWSPKPSPLDAKDGKEPRIHWYQQEMQVHIHRYPSLPLVKTLGLIHDDYHMPTQPGGAIAEVFTAVHPFRITQGLRIGLGREISRTAGLMPWLPIDWDNLKTRSR